MKDTTTKIDYIYILYSFLLIFIHNFFTTVLHNRSLYLVLFYGTGHFDNHFLSTCLIFLN